MIFFAKLRYGFAFLFEKVGTKDDFGPHANVTGEGCILAILPNIGRCFLPHHPASETCLLVKWNKHYLYGEDVLAWETADWFVRNAPEFYGLSEPNEKDFVGIWSVR